MGRKDCVAGFFGLSAAAALGLAALLLMGLLLGCLWGCTSQVGAPRWADRQMRPASDTARLVQNAAYLKRIGRLELALKELEEARLREPDNLELLDLLIQTYEDLGDFDRAEELYQQALSRGGHHPALENNRCFSLYLQGRLEESETCFRKILSRQPDNHKARNNLGLVLCRLGRDTEALAMWRQALSDVEARGRLGQALAALGKEVPPSLAVPLPPSAAAPSPSPPRATAPPAAQEPAVTLGSPVEPRKSEDMKKPVAATPAPPAQGPATPPSLARTDALPEPQAPPQPVAEAGPTPAPGRIASPPAAHNPGVALAASSDPGKSDDLKKPVTAKPAPSERAPQTPPSLARTDALPEPPAPPRPVVAAEPPPPPARPAPVAGDAQPGKAQAVGVVSSSRPAKTQAASTPSKLTAQDLHITRIELKNGNGAGNQAKETRRLLALEGFTVAGVGNHIDFGLEETTIAFRPEAAKMAQILAQKFFPHAKLEPGGKVSPTADIRVSLGRDCLAEAHLSRRLPEAPITAKAAPPAAAASAPAAPPSPRAANPPASPPSRPHPPGSPAVPDLSQTGIELKNGNGVQGQARELRSRLALEGFTVVGIGNHLDFGLDKTVIAYRPEAAQVARTLSQKFFPGAILEVMEDGRFSTRAAVRVSLGRDLVPGPERLAQAAP